MAGSWDSGEGNTGNIRKVEKNTYRPLGRPAHHPRREDESALSRVFPCFCFSSRLRTTGHPSPSLSQRCTYRDMARSWTLGCVNSPRRQSHRQDAGSRNPGTTFFYQSCIWRERQAGRAHHLLSVAFFAPSSSDRPRARARDRRPSSLYRAIKGNQLFYNQIW